MLWGLLRPRTWLRRLRFALAPHFTRPSSSLRGRSVDLSKPLDLRRREILLTFDDGPTVPSLEVLHTLSRFDVSAAFFMIGVRVEESPALARYASRLGHVVGSHTHTHPDLATLPEADALVEIRRGHAALERALAGTRPAAPLFRFPFLSHNRQLTDAVKALGLVILGADIDSLDWRHAGSTPAALHHALKQVDDIGAGVILLHDIHASTAAMLPAFLEALRARGYSVVTPTMPAQLDGTGVLLTDSTHV